MTTDLPPWHRCTTDQMARPGHDPAACPACTAVGTPAWLHGARRALEAQTHLPLSSGDTRPGRDGYDQ